MGRRAAFFARVGAALLVATPLVAPPLGAGWISGVGSSWLGGERVAWADDTANDAATSDRAEPGVPGSAARTRTGGVPLERILELAEQNHPNIAEARARVTHAEAQLDEAYFAPFSQFKATGGFALAPTIRGNNTFSPNTDVSLTSSLGLAWRAGIDGVLPLWTFGKIDNLWDAAEANVAVNEADLERQRDEIRFAVRQAYFGLQLARDSQILLADARRQIDKAVEKLQKEVDDEEGDPIDLLKLQTFAAELEVHEAEAERFADVALSGLRFFAGRKDLDIPDAPIAQPDHRLGHVTRYLSAARLYRPELDQATAGLVAREAQLRLQRSNLFPDLGLGLSMGLSAAPEVADQLNPFVSDRGNYFHYGVAIVFQWKLDFLPQAARIRQAEAELEQMRATQRYALGGVATEVENAYAEVIDWQKRLVAYSKAAKYAKQWLVRVQQGIDIGTLESDELLDPAKAYALQRYNVLKATMELDVAMSKLAKVTGWDAIAPSGK
jgi:outer membrane protein TolC